MEVKENKYFPLILDETRDISNKEQLLFCVRFVASGNEIREEFLKFMYYDDGVISKDLFNSVQETLDEFGLDLLNC